MAIKRLRLCSITRLRNSLRAVEYCSRLIKSARLNRPCCSESDPISPPQQSEGMYWRRGRAGVGAGETGLDLVAGHRTVAGVMVGAGVADAPDHRLADLHRHVAILLLHAVGSVVPGTPLDRLDLRA